MLTHIVVTNFAIVEKLAVDLHPGFSVLTGETGAGKSILVDAIGFALGDRADTQVIGPHGERAEVSLEFDLRRHSTAQAWLQERALDNDGECLLRRVLTKDGRSRAFINGQPVPLQNARGLGELIVDIHGQHAHQSLLKREVHVELLDGYAGLREPAAELRRRYETYQRLQEEFAELSQAAQQADARRDYLNFQIEELTVLALRPGEIEHLDEQHRKLAHAEKLLRGTHQALQALDEDEQQAVRSILSRKLDELSALSSYDSGLGPVCTLLNEALIALQEATDTLRHYSQGLELDPQQFEELEQRLASVHQLARKHRIAPPELPALLQRLQDEARQLAGADARLGALPKLIQESEAHYYQAAQTLSQQRHGAAKQLAAQIQETVRGLGMPQAVFQIAMDSVEPRRPTPFGLERIEFLVSANAGYAPGPLQKVASGGELSRLSLAIEVATANAGTVPTLVFDEVDTGISGGTAETVGQQLRTLGQARQVLCVTHLPQVAALGHQHYRVSKRMDDATTRITIEALAVDGRTEELARMLGGREITQQTRAHAKEMLARGQKKKRA
jgi:DNA repair protein RecN (Recombination protein N)